ncbi:MAG: hypothetical protein QG577_939 [Thermodesulfobacteriota bacterium]|nr:hypothetical protein [Thermodesulfobacteriota bacterium]
MGRPDIFLVNPWIHDFAAYDLWAKPLGLLILGTRLRALGWEPHLIDFMDTDHPLMPPLESKPDARGRFHRTPIEKPASIRHVPRTFSRYGIKPECAAWSLTSKPEPKVILVTTLMTYWYPGVKEAIELLRETFPTVPIVLGGIYASIMPSHAWQICKPDEVVHGPGEHQLPAALDRVTGIRSKVSNELEQYELQPCLDLMTRVRFLPLLTSRGCPLRCSYCASSRLFPQFIKRPVDEVVEFIGTALDRHGVKDVVIYDDAFLHDAQSHAVPLLELCSESFPDLRWHTPNGLHVNYITPKVAQAMKSAGFETIRLGFETSADGFHRLTGGKTNKTAFIMAIRNLFAAGFERENVAAYLLVGLPGQTRAQIEDDVDFVLETGVVPKLAEYSPIPGTSMWESAKRRSRYPIETEPLFHNCTLLPSAEEGVDIDFVRDIRRKISDCLLLTVHKHVDK